VQRLLRPPPRDWSLTARRFCLSAFVLAGVLPNLGATVMNIVYNWFEIIRQIGPEAKAVFFDQVMIVNPVAYLAAIILLVSLAAPIFRCVRARTAGIALAPTDLERARRRCLSFGDWVAWVSAVEWAISGIVFPVWLHLKDVSINRGHYLHFLTSQVLCGLIAAGLSFFAVSFLSARAFYPALIDPHAHDPAAIGQLRGLARRTGVYFVLAIASYFLATFAVLWLADTGDDRLAIGALGAVGFPSFVLAYWLSGAIRRDLETLALVAQPGADGPGSSGELADSSWSTARLR
jgi:hypothetical protein